MKNLILFISIFIISFQFVIGQKEVFQRIKLADKKVEWIVHVDSLGGGVYLVVVSDDHLFYVDSKSVSRLDVSNWMASSQKGHYLRSEGTIYRIRQESRKDGIEVYADKLEGSKFIEPQEPFIVVDSYLSYFFNDSNLETNYLMNFKDSTLNVLYVNPKDFKSSKFDKKKLPTYKKEENVQRFYCGLNEKNGYTYLIPQEDYNYRVQNFNIEDNEIKENEYQITFDSKPKGFIELYSYDNNKLMIIYVDEQDKIQYSSFILKGTAFIQLSNATIGFEEVLKEYATDNSQTMATLLSRSWYSEKFIWDNDAIYHWITMIDSRGELDLMLIKIIGDDIEWVSYIPRGAHSTTFINNIQLDGTKKSDVLYEFTAGNLILHDIEDKANFTDQGQFLKSSLYVGRKRVYSDIIVDLETGKVTRKMLGDYK